MSWIEIPIFCNTARSYELKKMGLEADEREIDVRFGCIDTDKVAGFYPSTSNTTIVHANGECFEIDLEYFDFKLLITGL